MLTSSERVVGSRTLLTPDLHLKPLYSTLFSNPGSFIPGITSSSSAKNGEKTLGTPKQTPPFCGPHSRTGSTPFIFFNCFPDSEVICSQSIFIIQPPYFQGTQRRPHYTLRKNTIHHPLFISVSTLSYFCLYKLDSLQFDLFLLTEPALKDKILKNNFYTPVYPPSLKLFFN